MSVGPGPALDHEPTRRALARRWRWAIAEVGLGGVILVAATLGLRADVEEAALAFVPGLVLVGLGGAGLWGAALLRRGLRRNRWQRYEGRTRFAPGRAYVLEARHGVSGQRVVVRVVTANWARFRSFSKEVEPLWLAVGDHGWGAVSTPAFEHVVLAARYPAGSRRQRDLESSLAAADRRHDNLAARATARGRTRGGAPPPSP